MSKLSFFIQKSFLTVLILGILVSPEVYSQNSVRLESKRNILQNGSFHVSIYLDSLEQGLLIDGFSFVIDDLNPRFLFQSVEPGTFFDSCQWEDFQYSFLSDTIVYGNGNIGVRNSIKIEATADLFNNLTTPSNYIDGPTELVQLTFFNTGDSTDNCGITPMRFVWTDCSDNSITIFDNDTLFVSNEIYEGEDFYHEQSMDDPSYDYPSIHGINYNCLNPLSEPPILKQSINFYNSSLASACSNTSSIESPQVYIESHYDPELGGEFTTHITALFSLEDSMTISGFDFLIAYDASMLNLQTVNSGTDLLDCGWEYFTYRSGQLDGCAVDCPDVVRIVAVADINNATVPTCLIDESAQLAQLTFLAINDVSNLGKSTQLQWIWNDCGDNLLSSLMGDTLFASLDVYNYILDSITSDTNSFPTFYGAPAECNSMNSPTAAFERKINYVSNFIGTFIPAGSLNRGDINLNEIQFEIADYVLFTNYFIYGLSVFIIDLEAQIDATDTNADGLTLTFNDLVYLFRIIVGEVNPPFQKISQIDTSVVIVQDTIAKTISIDYPDSLYGLFLVFDDSISTSLYPETSSKRIILDPFGNQQTTGTAKIAPGLVFSYTGTGNLISADASIDGITPISVTIEGSIPSGCCADRGNVDADPSGTIDISDLVFLVDFMFNAGNQPPCLEAANVDGMEIDIVDISDLVYLVDFMFNQGPPPPPCP